MKVNLLHALLASMICIPLVGQAARPLGPPIEEYFKGDNRVASGVVTEKNAVNIIVVQVSEYLFQSDDENLNLKVSAEVFNDVKIGAEYVFVFSRMRKNALLRDEWEVDPEGPGLVKARGLETPAIYESNVALLALLRAPDRRGELTTNEETSLLLSVAENNVDNRARELAIFELYLRGDLQSSISRDNAQRYAMITASADPRLKNFLLQGARHFPEGHRAAWLGREYRETVAAYDAALDLNSDIPLLIKNSLLGLREEGAPKDLEVIGRHLYSNAPGVAGAALEALDAIDPRQALVLAEQAVKTDKIHLVTRRELKTYIKEHTGA